MHVKSWFTDKLDNFADDPEYLTEEAILDFTEKLVAKMQELKVSRTELAKRLDVSKAFVTKLLNGNPNMTIKTMVSISNVLGCKLNLDIYSKKNRPSRNLVVLKEKTESVSKAKPDKQQKRARA